MVERKGDADEENDCDCRNESSKREIGVDMDMDDPSLFTGRRSGSLPHPRQSWRRPSLLQPVNCRARQISMDGLVHEENKQSSKREFLTLTLRFFFCRCVISWFCCLSSMAVSSWFLCVDFVLCHTGALSHFLSMNSFFLFLSSFYPFSLVTDVVSVPFSFPLLSTFAVHWSVHLTEINRDCQLCCRWWPDR